MNRLIWPQKGLFFYPEVIKVIGIIPLDVNTHNSVDTLKKTGMNLTVQISKELPFYDYCLMSIEEIIHKNLDLIC